MDLGYSLQCEDYYPDWMIDLDPSDSLRGDSHV